MIYFFSAVVVTYLFWIVLSGHYTAVLLAIGGVSALAVVTIASRMAVIDKEGYPIYLLLRAGWYWPWLIWQIIKSGLNVSRIILSRSLPISPTLINVKANQKTVVGIVTYANSITLTPGTISVEIENNDITVHALTQDGALDLTGGEMDRMVTKFEGLSSA